MMLIDKPESPGWYWCSGPNYGNPSEQWPKPRPVKVFAQDGKLMMPKNPRGVQEVYGEYYRWWGPAIKEPEHD